MSVSWSRHLSEDEINEVLKHEHLFTDDEIVEYVGKQKRFLKFISEQKLLSLWIIFITNRKILIKKARL